MGLRSVIAVAALAVLLSGCSSLQPAIERASEIADAEVQGAIFILCRGARVGAIVREYDTPEEAELWQRQCQPRGAWGPSE